MTMKNPPFSRRDLVCIVGALVVAAAIAPSAALAADRVVLAEYFTYCG
jgi:hypothetical protein